MAYSVPPAEIQQAVQRLSGVLVDRLEQAFDPLINQPDVRASEQALRRYTKCVSSIYDIASAPLPQESAMDMYVFVNLCSATLTRYWIPKALGDAGLSIEQAFRATAEEIGPVLNMFLTPEERRELDTLIGEWLARNPDQVYVEAVRLNGLAAYCGQNPGERERRASGLLASVRSATQSADQALLLGERAMFLVPRLPSIVRGQVRLAARQITMDALSTAKQLVSSAREAITGQRRLRFRH
jgi:hypothetical protein